MKTDSTTNVQELKDAIRQFRDERGWDTSATPRNVASSIVVEAAELLEHFQWGEYNPADRQEIVDELADVVNYCLVLANTLDIDLTSACHDKLERVKQKFPTAIFNPANDNPEAYKRIKREHRQKKG